MKKIGTLFLAFIFTLECLSQVSFEQGYFIDTTENKTECFIKNSIDSNIAKKIKYRLSENGETKTVDLSNIKEFVIYNNTKFIKRKVDIGKPSKFNKNEIDYVFNNEEVFLKVLVEGKADLYYYYENGIEYFFFTPNNLEIEQLVFKTFVSKVNNKNKENSRYKKQLFDNLICETITFKEVNNLKYDKKELVNFFIKFNECKKSNATVYYKKVKIFNINLRPRVNSTSLILDEIGERVNPRSYDFGNKTLGGIGIEVEVFFPFLNNKWSLSIEPTYQGKFSSEVLINDGSSNIGESISSTYKSFEIPITVRHYLYINNNSKIFLNASLVQDFSFKSSSIDHEIFDNTIIETIKPSGSINFAFGAGYKFKNKYSIEARYYTKRNIVNNLVIHSSTYNMFSIICGYRIF